MTLLRVLHFALLFILIAGSVFLMVQAAHIDAPIIGEFSGPAFELNTLQFRLISIGVAVFTLLLVYSYARDVLGRLWALLAVFLTGYSFHFLSIGHFLTTEIWQAFTAFVSVITFLYFIQKPAWKTGIVTGIAFAAAQFTSLSHGILIFHVLIMTLLYVLYRARELHHAGSSIARIFRMTIHAFRNSITVMLFGYAALVIAYTALGWNFFSRYLFGLRVEMTSWFSSIFRFRSLQMFWNNETLPFKITIGLAALALLVIAIRAIVRYMRGAREGACGMLGIYFNEIGLAVLLLLIVVFDISLTAFIPLLFVLVVISLRPVLIIHSATLAKNPRAQIELLYRERIKLIVRVLFVVSFVVWHVVLATLAMPRFLPIDRGQDLYQLVAWVDENRIERIAVDYFGSIPVSRHLGDRAEVWWSALGPPNISGLEWFAVSDAKRAAPSIHLENTYAWLKDEQPYARVGTTISVYRFDLSDYQPEDEELSTTP